jgi:hypothetical protein
MKHIQLEFPFAAETSKNETETLVNPHPCKTYQYSWRDMLDCWIAARENLVRWGIGDGDKPDFSVWIKEYWKEKIKSSVA